jgi:hypothetical protein
MDLVKCDCGCGEAVTLELPGGFKGVTVTLAACSARRDAGIVSLTFPRSMPFAPATAPVAHRDGLVAFG